MLTWIPIAGDKFGLFEAEALVQGPRSRTERIVFPVRRHEDILIGGEHIQHHADKGRSDAPPPRLRMYGEEADAVVLIREHQHAEAEVASIMAQMEQGSEKPRPKIEFEIGEEIRVKNGPFKDFNGRIEAVDYDKSRLQVFVSIFSRETLVDLDFNEVEKI